MAKINIEEIYDIIIGIIENTDEMKIICDNSFNIKYINHVTRKRYPLLNKRVNFRELVDKADLYKIASNKTIAKCVTLSGSASKFLDNPPEMKIIPIVASDSTEGFIIFLKDKQTCSGAFDEYKASVIFTMLYELKNPITMIFTCLELIKKKLDEESMKKVGKYLEQLTLYSYSLHKYTNNIIETIKTDNKLAPLNYSEFNICKQINITCKKIEEYLFAQNIEIEIELEKKDIVFCFDVEKIETALLNVLISAVRNKSEKGKITIAVEDSNNSVSISITGENISFTQCDEAIELDLNWQDYKLSSIETGIYNAKSIILQHGGTFLFKITDDVKKILFEIPKKQADFLSIKQYEKYKTDNIIKQIEREMMSKTTDNTPDS